MCSEEDEQSVDDEQLVEKATKRIGKWTHRPLPPGGLPSEVTLEDVISHKRDRKLMDALLESSEDNLEDTSQLIGTLFCGDWKDAVTGWSLTQPNVKYAWLEKPREKLTKNKPDQERKARRDAAQQSKKKQQRNHNEVDERSWRTKVEPGTYRYNPDFGGQFKPDQILLQKRLVDPTLQHHIDKVREHLEKTLMKQTVGENSQPGERLQPLPSIEHKEDIPVDLAVPVSRFTSNEHKHGQYVVTLTDSGRRHSDDDQNQIDDLEIGGKGDASFQRNGYGRQSDTKLLKRNHRNNYNHSNKRQRNQPHDLVTALGQKLNEILMDDALRTPRGLANLSLSRKVQKAGLFNSSSITSSYERFPTTSISPTPQQADAQPVLLNPLTKVTPHQRHIHDNNEIIAINSNDKVSKTGTAQSSTGSLGAPFDSNVYVMDQHSPDDDFIQIGISGHRVHSAKSNQGGEGHHILPQTQHGSSGGSKFHKLPLTHGKKVHPSDKDESIDEMHRGVIDREAAAALAQVLMPGVSGRKIDAAPSIPTA